MVSRIFFAYFMLQMYCIEQRKEMYWQKKYGLYTLRNARMGVTLDIINEGINSINKQITKVPILIAAIIGTSNAIGTVVT